MRKIIITLIIIAILLNPFDLGLWTNKLFGDTVHFTLFAGVLIVIYFMLPQKTMNGKLNIFKRIFKGGR